MEKLKPKSDQIFDWNLDYERNSIQKWDCIVINFSQS